MCPIFLIMIYLKWYLDFGWTNAVGGEEGVGDDLAFYDEKPEYGLFLGY